MAESVTGLSQLSTARSSASQSGARAKSPRSTPTTREGRDTPSRKKGRTPKPKRKRDGGDFSELKESLSSGKPLTIRGKGGNFKTHTGRGNLGDAGGRRGACGLSLVQFGAVLTPPSAAIRLCSRCYVWLMARWRDQAAKRASWEPTLR